MNGWQLLTRNLRFYWRGNLAVILGVVAATAVITGALIVGDSVRASLRAMSLARVGSIDHAVLGDRFFRQELALDFAERTDIATQVVPLLLMQGTIEYRPDTADAPPVRAGKIQVYGVEEPFWDLLSHADLTAPADDEIVVSQRVAEQLGLAVGDEISLIVEIPAAIPRDALLGEREEVITEVVLSVAGIAAETTGVARFGFNPSQQLPRNAFVNLGTLQQQVGLEAVQRSRRNPIAKPARVNALMIAAGSPNDPSSDDVQISPQTAETLSAHLNDCLTLEDLALRLVENKDRGYVSLESEQMILEQPLADLALETAEELGLTTSPVLVYLLNEMWNPKDSEQYSMYSVVAGVDMTEPAPFGEYEFQGPTPDFPLGPKQVLLNEWLAQDLGVAAGDPIRVKYHVVGDRGELPEDEAQFEVAGVVALTKAANDQGFAPNVPGVTDADTYADWREPFPLKRDRITDRDDVYWEEYRTTPKILMSLDGAQRLWTSRYGSLTSVRMAPSDDASLADVTSAWTKEYLAALSSDVTRVSVQPIKWQGLRAAEGTTDFTGLFIGFSFFLILAATILVGLMFRLGIERRVSELGLLTALGFTPRQTRQLFLYEGALLVGLGAVLGAGAAIAYADLMIYGLTTWWYGAIGTRFLFTSVEVTTLITGMLIAGIVALGAIAWALWQTRRLSTRDLLAGVTQPTTRAIDDTRQARRARRVTATCFATAALLVVLTVTGAIPNQEAFSGFSWQVVMFFVVGITTLVGSLSLLSTLIRSDQALAVDGAGTLARARLGFRNAARNRGRSTTTTSLIAWATFVIVAVAAGQQNPTSEAPEPRSGNGGFTLVAETNLPILYDLNTKEGRAELGFDLTDAEAEALMERTRVFPFRVREGENASCLNLYQTQLPTILGVPADVLDSLIEEDRFTFANTPGDQPWQLLREPLDSGQIPVLGDMNTLMYSLHLGIGQTLKVPPVEGGPGGVLEIRGMLNNSVLQGVLLMSEEHFLELFPRQAGFSYFLVDVDPREAPALMQLLESHLGDYGFDAERVAARLADFLAVQNTYLSTFQALGGLGLLLGTIGLATVMLRNVIERRGELALLRAVGFRRAHVAIIVLWENAILIAWGLCAGTAAALLAMLPHLLGTAADVPWDGLAALLATVFAVGMLAALGAVREAVQLPILSTLRGE